MKIERARTPRRLPTAEPRACDDDAGLDRREFVKFVGGAFLASLGLTTGCTPDEVDALLQDHFTRLSGDELEEVVSRLEKDAEERFAKQTRVSTTPAKEGVVFGYALDLAKCIGCRRCVYACVEENNQSRDPQIHWIRVFEMEKGNGIDFGHGRANPFYDHEQVPQPGKFYLPVACQQCENPPCVSVCPTEATWQEPDGIVVIDYNWCIGCRYCIAACPYEARHFNWKAPSIPAEQFNPTTHYLGNRPRPVGVVEKCTWCIQRTREGRYPACVEGCPTGSRKFGNLLDPGSEVRKVLETKHVYVLKSELNTRPKFFYYYGVEPR